VTIIDLNFDVYSDTPKGKDPDSYSPTLRRYHQTLWSKNLLNGNSFDLDNNYPRLLHHNSELGEFWLASDSIGHTYSKVKSIAHVVNQVSSEEINSFFLTCSTIGAYIIFPAKRVDNKMTINGSRGLNHNIKDRFDLTLECIRLHYKNETSPLSGTFDRYASFFGLFDDFKGYTDFFLLQDLVKETDLSIKFLLPFDGFENPALPRDVEEYKEYKNNLIDFVRARGQRMLNSANQHQ
jgi:hypothetical protein